MKDYSKAAGKWQSAVQGAGQAWLNGVQATDVSPAQAAIAQQAKLVTNWNNAVTSGRWAASLGAWTIDRWKAQTASVGAAKYAAGATKGVTKLSAYFAAASSTYAQARALRQSNLDPNGRIQANQQLMLSLKGITKRASY